MWGPCGEIFQKICENSYQFFRMFLKFTKFFNFSIKKLRKIEKIFLGKYNVKLPYKGSHAHHRLNVKRMNESINKI